MRTEEEKEEVGAEEGRDEDKEKLGEDEDKDEGATPRFGSRPSVRLHSQHKEMMDKINELTAANYHSAANESVNNNEEEEEEEEEFVHFESKESYQEQPRSYQEQPRSSKNANFILRHGSLQQILALRNSVDEESKEDEEVDRSSGVRSPIYIRSITMNGDFGEFPVVEHVEKPAVEPVVEPVEEPVVEPVVEPVAEPVVESTESKPSAKTTSDSVIQVTIESADVVDSEELKIDITLKKIAELEGLSRVNSFRIATPVTTTKSPIKLIEEENEKDTSEDVVLAETSTVPIESSESTQDIPRELNEASESTQDIPQQLTMIIETEELERIESESRDDDEVLLRTESSTTPASEESTTVPALKKSTTITAFERSTEIPALERSTQIPAFARVVRIQKPTLRAYQPANYMLPQRNHPGYVLRGQLYHVVQQPRLRIGHPGFQSIQRPPYPPSFLPPLLQYPGRAYPIYRNI